MKPSIKVFLYLLLATAIQANAQTNKPDWTVNPGDFEFSMEVTVQMFFESTAVTSGGMVGAFIDGTLQGVIDGGLISPNGKLVYIVQVHANSVTDKTVTFKFYDTERDRVYEVTEMVPFVSDGIVGNAFSPMVLHGILFSDETLSDLKVDGTTVIGFDPAVITYTVEVPKGTSLAPTITGTSNDIKATVDVNNATVLPGSGTITVTAENGFSRKTYTVVFVFLKNTIATLSDLAIDGSTISGFSSSVFDYNINLQHNTNEVPPVTATLTDPLSTYVTIKAGSLPGSTNVVVTAEDGVTIITYTINFTVAKDIDANLSEIKVDGTLIAGFDSNSVKYDIELPHNTLIVPNITAITNDPLATKVITAASSLPGITTIVVTAEDGTTLKIYEIYFTLKATSLIQKNLSAGWTWFSVNVEDTDMSISKVLGSIQLHNGDYIKNQVASSTYYTDYGWFGILTTINPSELYKVKLAQDDILVFEGIPVDAPGRPIYIYPGWNWIGYLPVMANSVDPALSSINPVANDYLKNQTKSSTFYEGVGWFGELTEMTPLDGYMLKSGHSGTLNYKEPPETSKPTVVTAEISVITESSGTSGGNITSDGGESISARGICWSTSSEPTLSGSKTTDGTGKGIFISSLTGLTGNSKYYVRSYATNSIGTSYGNEISFKTNPVLSTVITTEVSAISQTTASSGGNATSDGGANITAHGVCWSILQNPSTADAQTNNGTGTGSFTSELAGLTRNTIYFVRAYATNDIGTSYGSEVSFITLKALPEMSTTPISSILQTSAISGGTISDDGGASVTSRGVCWSTSSTPTIDDFKTNDGIDVGTFSSALEDLTRNTTYYVRAYATNSVGTGYGTEISFKTEQLVLIPTVTTASISNITETAATSGGNVASDGGADVTMRGICWSINENPTLTSTNSNTENGTGVGAFISSLIGLTANTSYYVRAYAQNSSGVGYGDQINFTTSPILPTVTTADISEITEITAIGGGIVTSDGGATVNSRGVCWSNSPNPTISDFYIVSGSGTGIYSCNIGGLSSNTNYYLRAYATNSTGTAYGLDVIFRTIPGNGDAGTFIDGRDSKIYNWVKIDTQVWMAENLAYLPSVSPSNSGSNTTPYYYVVGYEGGNVVFAKQTSNYQTYGVLYNWPAAQTACPEGWHLPSDEEWKTLEIYLGMSLSAVNEYYFRTSGDVGDKLKESGISHWNSPNSTANNSSGFTALPGGYQNMATGFGHFRTYAHFWSSWTFDASNAWNRALNKDNASVWRWYTFRNYGLSVRCLKN